MIALELKNVSKTYVAPDGVAITALSNLSLDILPGEFLIVVGPNGSGKSTLLNLVAGRERTSSGTINATVDGKKLNWTQQSARSRRSRIARIRQDPVAGTVDDLTVVENVRFASLTRFPIPFRDAVPLRWRKFAESRLTGTALAPKIDSLANQLSHGQRQLLALEMAATRSVQLLLLDEPTASLDRKNATFCMERVEQLRAQQNATVLLVTHDMVLATRYGDRLVVLRDGEVQFQIAGDEKAKLSPEDVFRLSGF